MEFVFQNVLLYPRARPSTISSMKNQRRRYDPVLFPRERLFSRVVVFHW